MKQFILASIIAFLGSVMVANSIAEAKRLGGGKSFGRSAPSSVQQRQASGTNAAGQTAQRSGASRWLGPLAGLAAGGLIAAMLFGDGFEGFQILDFLLIAGLVFGGIMIFKAMRRSSSGAMHRQPVTASGPSATPPPSNTGFGGSSSAQSGQTSRLLEGRQRPSWFNEDGFLQAAKTHFIRLQAAWDKGDMKDIREYTTPELYAQLMLDRQNEGLGEQHTEVVTLNAELLGLSEEADQYVASVRYSGMIREEEGVEAQPFSEIWHVQRSRDDNNADWYIAGIEQEN